MFVLSFLRQYVVFLNESEYVHVFLQCVYIYIAGCDPSIKRGRVGIQVSRGEGLGSKYQEGRVGIQVSRGEGWDPSDRFNTHHIFVPIPNQNLDFQCHMSWSFLCSVSLG